MMRSASNWAWSHCSCSFHKLNAATSDRLFAFRVLSWASHMKSSTHCPLICRAEMDTTHGHHNWTCGCDNWNLLQIVYGIDKLHDQSSKKALNATWVGRPKTHQGMANNGTTLDHNDELYYYDLLWYWCIPRCMYVYIYRIYCTYTLFHLILEKPWTWILKIIYFLPPFSSQASNTKGIRSHEKSCPARIIDPRSWSKVLNPADGDFWDWILYPKKIPKTHHNLEANPSLKMRRVSGRTHHNFLYIQPTNHTENVKFNFKRWFPTWLSTILRRVPGKTHHNLIARFPSETWFLFLVLFPRWICPWTNPYGGLRRVPGKTLETLWFKFVRGQIQPPECDGLTGWWFKFVRGQIQPPQCDGLTGPSVPAQNICRCFSTTVPGKLSSRRGKMWIHRHVRSNSCWCCSSLSWASFWRENQLKTNS